ncbi:MAG: BrnA antitoxin family protein [Gemmatimonadaceae bacterium]
MSAKRTAKSSSKHLPNRGKADLRLLRRVSDAAIRRTSPPELADLPEDFWDEAELVVPTAKVPISLRVDSDVLDWFRDEGPRYQSRMNAVLRSYMQRARKQGRKKSKSRTA